MAFLPNWGQKKKPKALLSRFRPWTKEGKGGAPPSSQTTVYHAKSRREEAANQAQATTKRITIQVSDAGSQLNGVYQLPFEEGAPLRQYLRQVQLLRLVRTHAFYDVSDLERGRLRSYYVPTERSRILVMSAERGVMSHLQRSSVDTQELTARMHTESVSMRYTKKPD